VTATAHRPLPARPPTVLEWARPVIALAEVAAIAAQVQALHERGVLNGLNIASFFTIQSNVLCAVVLLGLGLRHDHPLHRVAKVLRGPVVLYMAMTGIVYAVLLAPAAADVGLQLPWVNFVLHVAAPLYIVVDWFVAPPVPSPAPRQAVVWLAFPVVWLAYTLIRGPIADWYPYPFIDPRPDGSEHAAGSWWAVVRNVAVLTPLVALFAQALVWITRHRRGHTATSPSVRPDPQGTTR
jgi:hypothetical protein